MSCPFLILIILYFTIHHKYIKRLEEQERDMHLLVYLFPRLLFSLLLTINKCIN